MRGGSQFSDLALSLRQLGSILDLDSRLARREAESRVCRGRGNDIQVDQLNNKGSAKMSRWEGLDEFVAVAEIGSFSRAAERLRV